MKAAPALILALVLCVSLSVGRVEARSQITIQGSTTVLPIAQRAAEVFMAKHPEVSISVRGGGSGNGIAALVDKAVQIATASRFIKFDEVKKAVANGVYPVPHRVALDGIAVIVNPQNPVDKLTVGQLKKIFAGEITNWKQVGGRDLKIVVVSRDSSSGTFETFQELVLQGARVAASALLQASNGAVADVVTRTPGAVGYVGLGYLSGKVKALRIGTTDKAYVDPSVATVQAGQYPLARALYMFTDGWPTGDEARFIDFVLSAEGQRIAQEEGFVPLR
ncbi:MAG TPA: phosphate ABC transporter substrate-binding protein [Firmicutes bacterium]|nr:phosphate ABC transporter substrate-binding protein [Bacillota bacterium]